MTNRNTTAVEQRQNRSGIFVAIFAVVLLGAVLIGFAIQRRQASKTVTASSMPQAVPKAAKHSAGQAGAGSDKTGRGTGSSETYPPLKPGLAASGASPQAVAASPVVQKLLTGITQFNSGGAVTQQRAEELKRSFKQLAEQGAAAVPAIREYFERLQDIDLDAIGAGKLVGYSSVRIGLLDTLAQIGGTEVLGVFQQTLQTTADPAEIAVLARHLDSLAPGQYREEALNAAREALAQAATGQQLGTRDVGPLFSVLQTYGNGSIVSDLEKALPQWGFYATLALAGLPDGAGIPALIRTVENPEIGGTGRDNFRLQILAQIAAQYPEAGTALIDQARLNQIPDWAWRRIATGLAGDQYQLTNPLQVTDPTAVSKPGLKTYHIEKGNQNFFSTPFSETSSGEQLSQRLALIDRLLAATSSPAARDALQGARATVLGRTQSP